MARTTGNSGRWAAWVILTGLAELLGIALGGVWWVVVDHLNPDPRSLAARLTFLALKALSGLVEGAVLGAVQASLMRQALPSLSARRFAGATAAVAVAGWAVGSSFSVFGAGDRPGGGFDPGPVATILLSSAFGLGVGAAFGGVQALALGGLGVKRWPWIVGNAGGWALGLPAIYVAASGVVTGPVWALGAGGGLLAGLAVGAATALAFSTMIRGR